MPVMTTRGVPVGAMSLCYVATSMPDERGRALRGLAGVRLGRRGGVRRLAPLRCILLRSSLRSPATPPLVAGGDGVQHRALRRCSHSITACSRDPGSRPRVARRRRPELERSIYTWTASLLFLATCTWWQPIAVTLYALDRRGAAPLISVQCAGVILTIAELGRDSTCSTSPASARSSGRARARTRGMSRSRPTASTASSGTRCTSPGSCSCSAPR